MGSHFVPSTLPGSRRRRRRRNRRRVSLSIQNIPDKIQNTYLSAVHAIIQHDAMDIPVLHTDDLPSSLSRLAGNCLGQVSSSPFLCFYAQFHCRWTTHGRILLEDSIHFLMARSRACFFSTLAAEAENERPPSPQHCSSTR